ncbi:hypothetical protein GCM10027187_38770 [Streptosporangium sandarakinum]|uniref:Uncharacterized protein n=1 Tax=Streptosporangium sandarakinum TaxID=1260955 RepID=A0A852UZD5_9ACTN|nr:DUF6461 domain-containing protein [Streptosporangium sandarakinum]NYF41026.1 hypothetical protein [Streptosporangium sandarakinum]
MIATPDDYAWLTEAADNWCFTYVRGLTPEQVVIRRGGRPEDFTPMTYDELGDAAFSGSSGPGAFIGVTTIGDWAFVIEPDWNGIAEGVIMPLSAGTRLVSHYLMTIKALDYFYWIEDGELRFCFVAQEGYMEEVPDELVETMGRIDSVHSSFSNLHDGPAFLLAERLTGITLTPQLLEESTYLCGVVPEPRSWRMPSPW